MEVWLEMDNNRVLLEAISKRLIAIQSTCDKARTDINKVLKETADLASLVQEAIALLPSDDEFVENTDVIACGTAKSTRDRTKSVMDIIRDVSKEQRGSAPKDSVLDRAEELGIERTKAEEIIDRMRRNGDVFEPRPSMLVLPDSKDDILLPRFSREKLNDMLNIMREVSKEHGGTAPRDSILNKAEERKIDRGEAEQIIDRLRRDGSVFESRPGMFKLL
jgi:DNA replicative helicase MCM subunit Mcm2 (Cdc46/Mcm family)